MSTPLDWLDYVGALGSAVGVVTGITGMYFGIAAYRKAQKLKQLDLRLQLRNEDETLRHRASVFPALFDRADQSRKASLAADGLNRSGQAQAWERALEEDRLQAAELAALLPAANKDYGQLDEQQLEAALAAAHALLLRVDDLVDKYKKSLAVDADNVRRRQQNAEGRVIAQSNRPQ